MERTFGSWAFFAGGVVLFAAQLLIALLPAPPAAPADLARWVDDHTIELSIIDELLFLATLLLTLATVVLFRAIRQQRPVSSLIGCCSLLLAMPLLAMVVMAGGRLVYPVFDISLSDDAIALVLSLFYGGLHGVSLLTAIGLIALGFAFRHENGWSSLPRGSFIAGALQLIGAFPWLTEAWLETTVAASLLVWMIVVGFWLRSAQFSHSMASQ